MAHSWKTPSASISTFAVGTRVRVIGRAVATGAALLAPVSGESCLAYTHQLFMDNVMTSSSERPPDSTSVAFAVEDETGRIAIAEAADVVVDIEAHIVAGEPDAPPAFGASIIARELGASGYTLMTTSVGCLRAGDRVAVVGIVERGADGVLRLVGTPKHPLLISTQPKALE